MLDGKKIIVVLPAYNAEKTLALTVREIPMDVVDEIILTDDFSSDNTLEAARGLGIKHIISHKKNMGYGANQKSCYDKALELGADIIVMLHPDYQYTPKLIEPMCKLVSSDLYDVVLGSRILGKGALKGGMPVYKYVSNRGLTFFQNVMTGQKLSEYHTGYRCFRASLLKDIRYENNSDNFIFDNQMLAQCIYAEARIGEIACPAKYFEDASSISFRKSVRYGLGVVGVSISYFLSRRRLIRSNLFQ